MAQKWAWAQSPPTTHFRLTCINLTPIWTKTYACLLGGLNFKGFYNSIFVVHPKLRKWLACLGGGVGMGEWYPLYSGSKITATQQPANNGSRIFSFSEGTSTYFLIHECSLGNRSLHRNSFNLPGFTTVHVKSSIIFFLCTMKICTTTKIEKIPSTSLISLL